MIPMPEVRRQWRVDRAVFQHSRPSWRQWSSFPDYKYERVLSYPEWVVPCRVKGCGAAVGEPCKKANGDGLHAKRIEDYGCRQRDLMRERDHPDWFHLMRLRMEQRAAIIRVEELAREQSRTNQNLSYARRYAEAIGVDPAMVQRAAGSGHQRFRREQEGREAAREESFTHRVYRALRATEHITNESKED